MVDKNADVLLAKDRKGVSKRASQGSTRRPVQAIHTFTAHSLQAADQHLRLRHR